MKGRGRGVALAAAAAVISGVAIHLNARGVRAAGDATVYTTAKNLVAAGALALLLLARAARGRVRPGLGGGLPLPPPNGRVIAGLLAIAVFGGGVPFVLFFEGLARESSSHAAFLQKTLVVWVALLAPLLLGERLRAPHIAAIVLVVAGQAAADGGLSGFRFGGGEALILGATLLWSLEVIIARRLLPQVAPTVLGAVRLVLGSAALTAWVAMTGRWSALAGLDGAGRRWALVTGLVLAGYVVAWFSALSLAPAVDVTAVLSGGALVTAVLAAADSGALPSGAEAGGLVMLAAGVALVAAAAARPRARGRAEAVT